MFTVNMGLVLLKMSTLQHVPGKYLNECMVQNCINKYYHMIRKRSYKSKKFFRFPEKDLVQRHKSFRLKFTLSRCLLCEDHFKGKEFTSSLKTPLLKWALSFSKTYFPIICKLQELILK